MSEWKEYKFSDFVEINPNVTLPSDESISYVEMKDLNESEKFCFPSSEREKGNGSKFQNYDTLFAKITPCLENGKICQVRGLKNNVGLGSTEFIVFRGKRNISNTDFIFYLSRWDEVRSHAEINLDGTSGRQRVPIACFDDLIIKMPVDIDEQKAIASILSSLDDKIDLLHRQNATLEKMAETLFRQWFIEEAKEEWEIGKLDDVLSVIESGKRPKGGIDPELTFGVPSIGAENINGIGVYDFSKTKFITEEFYHSMQRGIMKDYDVLIYKDGAYVGRKGMFGNEFPFKKAAVNEHVFILRSNEKTNQFFLYFLLNQEELEKLNANSAQPGLNQEAIKAFEIIIPPYELMSKFGEFVKPFIDKIFFNGNQIRTLTALRDTLLPKLMSGEITVEL
jgi:type I restriction enzyme S subunit